MPSYRMAVPKYISWIVIKRGGYVASRGEEVRGGYIIFLRIETIILYSKQRLKAVYKPKLPGDSLHSIHNV